jgi:hypothetical protein
MSQMAHPTIGSAIGASTHGASEPGAMPVGAARAGGANPRYLTALTWTFTLFNSLRVIAYLPTLWAIQSSGDASQHSLFTWLTWLGANLTMAAWLYEQQGRRLSRAVAVNACNATLCAAICGVIAAVRWG